MRDARMIFRQYENLIEELERQEREFGYLSYYMLHKIVTRERRFSKEFEKKTDTQSSLFPRAAKPARGGDAKNGEDTDRTAETAS